MRMMGELNFLLRLLIKLIKEEIFINKSMYAVKLVKKIGLEKAKDSMIPMSTTCKLDKDENGTR